MRGAPRSLARTRCRNPLSETQSTRLPKRLDTGLPGGQAAPRILSADATEAPSERLETHVFPVVPRFGQ